MKKTTAIQSASERSAYWDNIKGVLIALVVFTHGLYAFQSKTIINYMVDGIYFFHMPAFVFVSGFFSKSANSRSARSIVRLLSAYVILTAVHTIMMLVKGGTLEIVRPYFSAWYLLALIFWRIITPYFSKTKWSIPAFILLSLLTGFWSTINNSFAFSKTIAFYPFFLAGYFLPKERTASIISSSPLRKIPVGLATFGVAAVVALLAATRLGVTNEDCLFGAYQGAVWPRFIGRISIYAVAALCTIGLMLLAVKSKLPILTKAGRNSLAIYLIHRPLTIVLNYFVRGFSELNLIIYAVLFTLFVLVVFGSDTVTGILNRVLDYFTDGFMPKNSEGKTNKPIARLVPFMLIAFVFAAPLLQMLIRMILKQ